MKPLATITAVLMAATVIIICSPIKLVELFVKIRRYAIFRSRSKA